MTANDFRIILADARLRNVSTYRPVLSFGGNTLLLLELTEYQAGW